MEHKSFPGRLQRNRCVWAFQLPSWFRGSPLLQQSPWWDAVAHGTMLEENHNKTLQEYRSRIFLPKPTWHVPCSSAQAGRRQTQAAAVSAAGGGLVAHAEAGGEAYLSLTLTGALWKHRGHPHGLPEASKHHFQPCLWKLTDSILIPLLLKKVPHPKQLLIVKNFISLPRFLLYLFIYRMRQKRGRYEKSEPNPIFFNKCIIKVERILPGKRFLSIKTA